MEEQNKDDEVIDFSKFKNIFKKKPHEVNEHKTESHSSESKEEIELGNIKNTLKSKSYIIIPIILILIAAFFSAYIRIQPKDLHFADNAAENSIQNSIQQQVSSQIAQQYPNLPQQNRQELVNREIAKVKSEQKAAIDQQKKLIAEQLRNNFRYDNNKKVYMPDIDPYFYLRYARNIIEKGHIYDELKDGKAWDDHKLAPLGEPVTNSWHPYILLIMHKVYSIFSSDDDLLQSGSLFPIIFSALAVIPAFLIGRKIAGNMGGFFAAMMVAINLAGVSRTTWGHADTDAYNLFFPLLIAWLFIESMEQKSLKNKLIITGINAVILGLYSRLWIAGWWYVFDIILAALAIYIVYLIVINIKDKKQIKDLIKHQTIKDAAVIFAVFFILTALFVSLFFSFGVFYKSVLGPIGFTTLKQVGIKTIWPNVLTTVAELNPASVSDTIQGIGGKLFFFIAILGVILTITKKDNDGKPDIKYAVLIAIWFISTIYASTKGVRFVLLLVPGFALGFGAALGIIYNFITNYLSKELKIEKIILQIVVFVVFAMLLVNPIRAGYSSAQRETPIINDAWWTALNKIKAEAAKDAIITSWWDFGHHFKYIADRTVTFDGGTQNSPQAHWVGKALLTSNEDEAIGILRMLDCGANLAFEEVKKVKKDDLTSVNIVSEIVKADKDKAEEILKENEFSGEQIENILKYSHCDPPEAYFITSEDMTGKSAVWSHFGSWNFTKAAMYQAVKNKESSEGIDILAKRFGLDEKSAFEIYKDVQGKDANNWVSPWQSYVDSSGCSQDGSVLSCGGIMIDLDKKEILTGLNNKTPKYIVIPSEDDVAVNVYKKDLIKANDGSDIGAFLYKSGGDYILRFASHDLAPSMYTRLFYMRGAGLTHFKPFSFERDLFNNNVLVWKVDWNGSEPNKVPDFAFNKPEEIKAEEKQEAEKESENQSEAAEDISGLSENNTEITTEISNES